MSRRCILESECRNMIPTCVNGTIGDEHGPTCMKLFKNTTHPNSSHMLCLDRCPDEYKEDPHNPYGCISCNGTCPRGDHFDFIIISSSGLAIYTVTHVLFCYIMP